MTQQWLQFEVWIPVGDEEGQAPFEVATSVADTLFDFAHAAAEDFEFEPVTSINVRDHGPRWGESEST